MNVGIELTWQFQRFDEKMVAPTEIDGFSSHSSGIFLIQTSKKITLPQNLPENTEKLPAEMESQQGYNERMINEDKSPKISKKYFWSGGMGIVIALANSCFIFCAWPQHHIYLVPKAWHEFMTTSAIGFMGLCAASLILSSEMWLDLKTIKTWKNFFIMYLICVLGWILANVGYYHIYCVMLGLNPPMPLNIHVCGILTLVFSLVFLWFLIPAPIRNSGEKKSFQKRYAYYLSAQLFRLFAVLEYFVITWLFVTVDVEYQWTIGILLPIMREMNAWIFTRICYKSAGFKSDAIKITSIHEMACRHAVFLSVALSLLATPQTAFLCIGLDFAVNFVLCIHIIWRTKRNKRIVRLEDDTDLQELALNEKTVYVVPLAYFICFLVAYLGPNRWIIGNVGNTSWHFGKVDELLSPLLIMFAMFLVDFVGIVLWGILLKCFCNINYVKGYMYVQKKYWLIMAIHEGYSLNEVIMNNSR